LLEAPCRQPQTLRFLRTRSQYHGGKSHIGCWSKAVAFWKKMADGRARSLTAVPQSGFADDLGRRRRRPRENGATEAEINYLLDQRVELNAMTSDQLIAFIERKLKQHGIKKVIPEKEQLADAYKLFARSARIEKIITAELEKDFDKNVEIPDDLEERVRAYLEEHPEERWDGAFRTALCDAIKGGAPHDAAY
jgi:hypothetical protein